MKSKLVIVKHTQLEGENSVEVYYNGVLIGAIYGADGPGIRFFSKYPLDVGINKADIISLVEIKLVAPLTSSEGKNENRN